MRAATRKFDTLRRRARIAIAVEGAAWIAAAVALYVFASYGIDRLLHLEVGFRAVLLLGLLGGTVAVAVRRLARPLRIALDDDELALAVERQDPKLHQALISAVQFDRELAGGGEVVESEAMMRDVVRDVEGRLGQLPFAQALDARRLLRFGGVLAFAFAAVVSWAAVYPGEARLWALRNLALAGVSWPRDTRLEFLDVDEGAVLRVAERDDLTLRVRAAGVVPERVVLDCAFETGERTARPMELLGRDTFSVTLESLLEPLTVRAFGGDGETGSVRIELVPRPRITDLALTVHYPPYLAREPEPVADLGVDVRVPIGAELDVEARSDKPLERAEIVFDDELRVAATLVEDGSVLRARFAPPASGTLSVDGLDRDRLGPSQAPQVYLRLVADEAPKVEFETRGIGSLITAEARIPGELLVRDDHGLEAVSAVMQITAAVQPETGEAATPAPFESAPIAGLETFVAGEATFETATLLDLRSLDPAADPIPENRRVQPGQLLSLRFDARDNFAPTAHDGSSETMTFRIVTREKLLEELRRRQAEQRRELERLIARERAVRDELAEIVSPASDDPRADRAKLQILGLARQQQTLGRRSDGIAGRYEAILDELLNNRLFEATVTRTKHSKIVSPLRTLAIEDFPASSAATAAFAETGGEDARAEVVAAYDRILTTLARVLSEMEHTEDLAALLEALRVVIKTEERARELVEKKRDEAVEDLFDEPK